MEISSRKCISKAHAEIVTPSAGRSAQRRLRFKRFAGVAVVALAVHAGGAGAQVPADTKFISSATENLDGTVDFPVYTGTVGGQTVYFIMTEASSPTFAAQYGINYAPRLAGAVGSSNIQTVTTNAPPFNFKGTVIFNSGARSISPATGVLLPTPSGVAPATGDSEYSPLILLPNGTVVNAPHIQNNTGRHPKLLAPVYNGHATLIETNGFQGGQPVRYISTDASTPFLAAAENSTYAPKLQNFVDAAHADLALIDDGQRGFDNVESQGFDSAILDGLDPLNILAANPAQSNEYSPMWGVNPLRWNSGATVRRLRDLGIARASNVTAFELTGTVNNIDPVVNCPVIAQRSTSIPSSVTPRLANFYIAGRYQSSSFNQYTLTAAVVDGANGNAPLSGVLVAGGDAGDVNYSCTTNSAGTCNFYITLYPGDGTKIYQVKTLNLSTRAPGVRSFSQFLSAPGGVPTN